ncbi:NAD-dependent epimerase/dehydratase family protein [Nocardia higoensis]|uniref:NAD-dependent epimerase/dehydratase family protein n=1 Tax=Nocardia higoensis TaxID=228599 RepID=UPI00030C4E7C|nr:SDR family oxidoreductase [Nocardia higoensis]
MTPSSANLPRHIMVTGGCGYIGSALVPHLLQQPEVDKIVIVDNLAKGRLESVSYLFDRYPGRVQFVRTDIRRPDQMDTAVELHGVPEAIVHLAGTIDAASSLDEDKRILCEQVNHEATVALAERAVGWGVSTLVAHSSTSVYGHGGLDVLDEDSPCDPVTPYGKTKYASERILGLSSDDTRIVVFRPASVFGWAPGYRYEVAVNLLALYAHVGVPLTVYRTAETENRPYLAIDDCVASLDMALRAPQPLAGQVWNTVSFNATFAEILEVIKELYPSAAVRYTNAELVNQISFTVSGQRLYDQGFTPTGDLRAALSGVRDQLNNLAELNAGWLDGRIG